MKGLIFNVIEARKRPGYPVEYLVARLKGRSAKLIKSWGPLLFAERPELPEWYGIARQDRPEDAVAMAFRRELVWLYGQMHDGLRETFAPVFVFFELKTIFSCIRYKAKKGTEDTIERELSSSLLTGKLKQGLLYADSQAVAVMSVLKAFSTVLPEIERLYQTFSFTGQTKETESTLSELFLETASRESGHPNLRWFFSFLVDMRNLLSAYKHLRWAATGVPKLISGGSISTARIAAIADEGTLMDLTGKFAGRSVHGGGGLEGALLGRLYKLSERRARVGTAVSAVLDYIIKRHIEARNISLIFSSQDVDRETLRKEITA
jgi:vacuolar-type H+-ATPase subunit C/Vma6